MLKRLTIEKAGNIYKNLLNKIIKVICIIYIKSYSLYQVKKITNKVYDNIMNSVKV